MAKRTIMLDQVTFKHKTIPDRHGFIFADDHNRVFVDYLERDENLSDLELLKIVVSLRQEELKIDEILSYCNVNMDPIQINSVKYDFFEIKELVEKC